MPLVLAAQAGDAASFEVLYRRHARTVCAVLLGRADLTQEAFLAAWRRIGTLRDPAAFSGWLLTIARHLQIDHGRRARPEDPLEGATGAASFQTDADAHHRLEARQAIAAIRALPEAYRDTLLLRLVEGLTGPEIAARTGLTPESVRVNLCRGMKQLREALAPSGPATRGT